MKMSETLSVLQRNMFLGNLNFLLYQIRGWFIVDFISVFPFQFIFSKNVLLAKLVRLIRLPRLVKLIDISRFN